MNKNLTLKRLQWLTYYYLAWLVVIGLAWQRSALTGLRHVISAVISVSIVAVIIGLVTIVANTKAVRKGGQISDSLKGNLIAGAIGSTVLMFLSTVLGRQNCGNSCSPQSISYVAGLLAALLVLLLWIATAIKIERLLSPAKSSERSKNS